MAMPDAKMLDLIRSGGPAMSAGPAAMPDAPDPNAPTPPMASPMSTPEPRLGTQESARINIGLAMDLLEQSLPGLGSESEEGQKVMAALRSLTGMMGARGGRTDSLKNAEILQMLQSLPQAGGATPEMKAMGGMPAIPGMAPSPGGAPMPAGGPGGMPPMPPGGGAPAM